jgi:hypothetical protein
MDRTLRLMDGVLMEKVEPVIQVRDRVSARPSK